MRHADQGLHVAAVEKPSGEKYIWIFDDAHIPEALCSFGHFADREDLSLTFEDAARLAAGVRRMVKA